MVRTANTALGPKPPTAPNSPKAARRGYDPAAFFYLESNESGDQRFVAWTSDLHQLEDVFGRALGAMPDMVELLLKIELPDENDPWDRYWGIASRDRLLDLSRTYRRAIFQDGTHQLCVRDPDSREYFVLDDAGVVFVYSSRAIYREAFLHAGFEERRNELISQAPHWRQQSEETAQLLEGFIATLGLSRTSKDGETDEQPS